MFSFKFVIREDKGNSLRIQILNNRRKAELSLGISLTTEELNEALSEDCPRKFLHRRKYLLSCLSKIEEIKLELIQNGQINADVSYIRSLITDAILGKKESDFIDTDKDDGLKKTFAEFFNHFMESKSNKGYKETLKHTWSRIKLFAPNIEELTFEDISVKWLNDFDDFLIKHGSSQNTRAIHFRNIRTVINRAIDEEITEKYPFRRFKIKTEETRKRSLTVEQLRKLFAYPTEPADLYYVDMFKIIFMLIGINLVDLHGLTEITHEGRVEYRRAKTHKLYSIKVEPEALELIDKYRGKTHLLEFADRWSDHRYFRRQMNEVLQALGTVKNKGGRLAGGAPKKTDKSRKQTPMFPGLTSYWARHTWATIAYSLDIPKDIISQALGHTSGNSVTEIYIDRDIKKVDEANRRVLDWVLYGKR